MTPVVLVSTAKAGGAERALVSLARLGWEARPMVSEAMVLRTPVVAAAVGGPTEIVEDAASGLLVPPGRPDALAAADPEARCS